MTIIDCKRYSLDKPIGPDVIQRLLWVSDNYDRASHAMIATTSRFTSGAIELARDYSWRLSLKNHQAINDWLSNYGILPTKHSGSIWSYRQDK